MGGRVLISNLQIELNSQQKITFLSLVALFLRFPCISCTRTVLFTETHANATKDLQIDEKIQIA